MLCWFEEDPDTCASLVEAFSGAAQGEEGDIVLLTCKD